MQVEAAQATGLLYRWAAISVEDVLELLSAEFKFIAVRKYAVSILAKV